MSGRMYAKTRGLGEFQTGSYTGDGAATQPIVGAGFQPRVTMIYPQASTVNGPAWKTDADGLNAIVFDLPSATFRYQADQIISLDADGFTVGDGTPLASNLLNVAARVYNYICWG